MKDFEYTIWNLHIVDEDYKNIVDACKVVVEAVKERTTNPEPLRRYPMSLTFEMRFMSDSQSLLCPAVVGQTAPGRDIKVAYIEILAFGSLETRKVWEEFSLEIARKWKAAETKVKPLPHWGKMSELQDFTFIDYLWENNGRNMEEFLKQLKESEADPHGMFFNGYLEKIFTRPSK
eukprot:m.40708 g.40708  ORF g.40708 m.40708 type:complete len:176 (+) comp33003_c0_seq2:2065-2592(+)